MVPHPLDLPLAHQLRLLCLDAEAGAVAAGRGALLTIDLIVDTFFIIDVFLTFVSPPALLLSLAPFSLLAAVNVAFAASTRREQ